MLYFDKKTLSILKYIKRLGDKGATWSELRRKFGEDAADGIFLELLSSELYTVTRDCSGKWIDFDHWSGIAYDNFRSFTTAKSNEIIERRCFDFWKWIVPTIISVIALAVSALTA